MVTIMEEIDRDGIEPLHVQLAGILRRQIASGELAPGARLPSAMKLEEKYGLARGTIQKALAALRDEGLIVGVQGRGVFVKPTTDESDS
jgi:DNA-binding GntR family transcriptional regulator